jgi:hypothetical protein
MNDRDSENLGDYFRRLDRITQEAQLKAKAEEPSWGVKAVGWGFWSLLLLFILWAKGCISVPAFTMPIPSTAALWITASVCLLIVFVLIVVALGRVLADSTTPSAGSIFVMFVVSVLMPIVGLGFACCALSSSENRHLGMPFLLAAMFAFAIYFAGAYLGGAFTGAN